MSDPEYYLNEKITLRTPEGLTANINRKGAFVESLTAPDGQELIFPRQDINGKDRGGIPVCSPVFGPGTTVNLPQHGFARDLLWIPLPRDETTSEEESNTVRFVLLDPFEQDASLEPSDYGRLNTTLAIKAASHENHHVLGMTLILQNNSDKDLIATPGFHPYFPIGTIQETGLNLLYDDGMQKFDPAELAKFKTLPSSELGEVGFSNGSHNINIKSFNLPVPVVWTAHPDLYVCVEPTQAGAVTASLTDTIEEESTLPPNGVRVYSMQINWKSIG